MKVEKYDGSRERLLLAGMATDATTLASVSSRWDGEMFRSPWANVVGRWCVDHQRKYQKPPTPGDLKARFSAWAQRRRDEATAKLVESFVVSLFGSEPSPEVSSAHLIDLAAEHFNHVRLEQLSEAVKGHLEAGDVTEAEALVANHSRVRLGDRAGGDPFTDRDKVRAAFSQGEQRNLVRYPGPLGQFFRDGVTLARDCFVVFQGVEKSTKSMWLFDVAYRSVLQRNRTVLFEVGDQSECQATLRLLSRVCRRPARSNREDGGWPCTIKVPTGIHAPPPGQVGEPAKVDIDRETFDQPLDADSAWEECQRVMRERVKSNRSFFRLISYPSDTATVDTIRADLRALESELGWAADVVIIDYADLLAPMPGRYRDSRDAINKTWSQLRALSLEWHCLLVSATQADADAYERDTQDRRNFSEDKRKYAHVTGMVGINVTAREKEQQVCRLNWLVGRDFEFNTRRCIHVAQCLPLANPAVLSTY